MDALLWNRFQFGFTATYHYLFPQLTMGLALLILVFKIQGMRTGNERYSEAARFWARIFGLNFAMGVVTGIPMEFQFGTNWARFSRYSGGIIGLSLSMEGMFAFFMESSFLGLFLFGEKKLGPKLHLFATFMLFFGAWLSGYFIVTTNAFMQHPNGFSVGPDGLPYISNFVEYLFNPWALWQYAHTMTASVVTASFVITAMGAYWTLIGKHEEHARINLRTGIGFGLLFCLLMLFPTGDKHAKMVAQYQKPTLAAMEGKFDTSTHADLSIVGIPNMAEKRLDYKVVIPGMLSWLAFGDVNAEVKGLNDIPEDTWPNVPLLFAVYHTMIGIGMTMIGLMGLSFLLLVTNRIWKFKPWLLLLTVAFPLPYIATTAGWMTSEFGRQPWTVYDVARTADGTSALLSSGNVAFTAVGFIAMYLFISLLFIYTISRELRRGPEVAAHGAQSAPKAI